ncbi:hypothetical protein [Curtobacterium luteum]|uniref:hypothetical protein n=1 Tax=Curtobacterium luteum TaxID=33881 RepID=UPI0037F3F31B
MPESERPRRPVPAWVTAPPEDGLEARPAPATTAAAAPVAGSTAVVAPAPEGVGAAAPVPAAAATAAAAEVEAADPVAGAPAPLAGVAGGSAPLAGGSAPLAGGSAPLADVVVPDFPPDQDLLPPAPTSPAVHTLPFDQLLTASPAPVSPVDAGPLATPAAATPAPVAPPAPAVPTVGQPRFSVPGLEHVVVQGTEPEPTGPVGYRTPARFAGRQGAVTPPLTTDASAGAAANAGTPAPAVGPGLPVVPQAGAAPTVVPQADAAPTVAAPVVGEPAQTEPILQAGAAPTEATAADPATTRRLGATPGAVLGAVAGLATLGLAAWWFTAPATVHAVGVLLGVLALVVSIVVLRDRTATWQRPLALLGAVLGAVGTLVLLWAVASALLPAAGVTLPDLTGTGSVPTIAP